MGVACGSCSVIVWVTQPWRWRGVTWPEGRKLLVPVSEYRKWRGVGEFLEREYVRCRHWSGREYLLAVTCGGRLLGVVRRKPQPLEQYDAKQAPVKVYERRGCRCNKRRKTA